MLKKGGKSMYMEMTESMLIDEMNKYEWSRVSTAILEQ